jgi:hypothetical protein
MVRTNGREKQREKTACKNKQAHECVCATFAAEQQKQQQQQQWENKYQFNGPARKAKKKRKNAGIESCNNQPISTI